MGRLSLLAFINLAEANIYATHKGSHCYVGHGGTPLDAKDAPISDVSVQSCEDTCDNATNCIAYTLYGDNTRRRKAFGNCYLRSDVQLSDCEVSTESNWTTYTLVEPPPRKLIAYHLFEPKYTGLANKDAGDFEGVASFIFHTFSNYTEGNPEASLEHNIIEMSEVTVTGWGDYEECNAPGSEGFFDCPKDQADYCCTVYGPDGSQVLSNHTPTQLPGWNIPYYRFGYWFSFPKESRDNTWTETLRRRIAGKCLGDAWRQDAGGCDQCGDALDECVADCIQAALIIDDDDSLLKATWDRVFASQSVCPEVPFSGDFEAIV